MFRTVCYVEEEVEPGRVAPVPTEIDLGEFPTEAEAVTVARASMAEYLTARRTEYAWWIVRARGQELASWIADSRTQREFMVDLTTSRLVEVA